MPPESARSPDAASTDLSYREAELLAKLARVEALAKEWEGCTYNDWGGDVTRLMGQQLRKALDGKS